MSLQKKLLAIMVGAALSFSASANVDLGANPVVPEKFLKSVTSLPGSSPVTPPVCSAKVDIPFGFSVGNAGSSKYIVLELTGATFTKAFDTADLTGALANYAVSAGGAVGDASVTIEAVATATIGKDDKYTLNLAGATGITLDGSGSPVTVTSTLYETAGDAVSRTNPLPGSQSGTVMEFVDHGVDVGLKALKSARISIAEPTKFDADPTEPANTAIADLSAGIKFNACDANLDAAKPAKINLLVKADAGGFAAFTTGNVGIDACPATPAATYTGVKQAAVTDDEAKFMGLADTDFTTNLCLTPKGTKPMIETSFMCQVTLEGGAFAPSLDLDPVPCGNLQFAGSSDHVNFSTTPTSIRSGAYKQYFRITNPSATEGGVFVTVIADDGERVTFPMDEINGIDEPKLKGGASTKLFSGDAVYDAAMAVASTKNPDFKVKGVGSQKYRVIVRGQFGKNAWDGHTPAVTLLGTETESAIIIQSFHVSKNGNLLNQVK